MIKVFFSWQSDISQNTTTRAIRAAIDRAAAELTNKHRLQVTADEATRNVAGAPYIPAKLAEKIRNSDIFIGDITTIATSSDGKSLPNPNVTFELGLAAAHLGWERIVLLFNKGVAEFSNLPFDFDRHRISPYNIVDSQRAIIAAKNSLNELVKLAIGTIIDQNPLKPRELEGKSEIEIKHDRDVVNLRWFLRHMSVDLLGKHIEEMPDFLHYFAPVMHDGLSGVIRSPSFRLYDSELETILRAIVDDLGRSLEYDHCYRELNQTWVQAFGRRDPYADREAEHSAVTAIRGHISSLAVNLHSAVDRIRNRYIEIELDNLSNSFGKEYMRMIKSS